jgi:hypothetical protein
MGIAKGVRDRLLVESRHRCTICAEKCFEVHHIIEISEGGTDEADNLIVLCPNCHQHRYHRSGEFTRDQLRQYKQKLKEQNEIERRVLRNLEEIRSLLPTDSPEEVERRLRVELQEATDLVSSERQPGLSATIQQAAQWLAERDLMRGGARRAIEIEWEARKEQERRRFPEIKILKVDQEAFRKAPDFPKAYYLEFILNRIPNSEWADLLLVEWKASFYTMKRKTTVFHDRIVMIVSDLDNLQAHADFAKRLVEDTNQRVRDVVLPRIEQMCEGQKRKALEEFDAIRSMKKRTRDIRL